MKHPYDFLGVLCFFITYSHVEYAYYVCIAVVFSLSFPNYIEL